MKLYFGNKEELASSFKFEVKTSRDKARLNKAWEIYLQHQGHDCLQGYLFEILNASKGSNKKTVSHKGEIDNKSLHLVRNGKKVKNASFQSKTNGGNIADTQGRFFSEPYIVYKLRFSNSVTKYQVRELPEKIIPKWAFLEAVERLNLIHESHDKEGNLKGYNLQYTTKKFYDFLASCPFDFDRDTTYIAEELDEAFEAIIEEL